jgi:hypothetical protein
LALAPAGQLPAAEQECELLLAGNERRQARRRLARVKAPRRPARAEHPPSPHGFDEALEVMAPEVGALEETAGEAVCGRGDRNAAGLGHRLQAGREVRRFADHAALACLALAQNLTHHHGTGGDPDPGGERPGRGP